MCVPMCLPKTDGGIIHVRSLEEARTASFRREMVYLRDGIYPKLSLCRFTRITELREK